MRLQTLAAGATKGTYDLDEYYAELNVPILADQDLAKELSLSLASRYSDYSTFGDTTNSKIGLKWRPVDEVLVRGTVSEGFRAPTVSNLYGGGSQSFVTGFIDPCDSVYGVAAGTARCLQRCSNWLPSVATRLYSNYRPSCSDSWFHLTAVLTHCYNQRLLKLRLLVLYIAQKLSIT